MGFGAERLNALFLYDFEIFPTRNPPCTLDRMREDLRTYFVSRGWDNCGMDVKDSNVHLYGHVGRKNQPVTEDDRQALAEWARSQRFRGTVRVGKIEAGDSLLRRITEWVFEVDNLTEAERAETERTYNENWRMNLPAWVRDERPLDEVGWSVDFRMTFILDYLDSQSVYRRRMRLFASACCRRVWDLLQADAAKRIVELSEAFADGEASETELNAAYGTPDFDTLDALNDQDQSKAEVRLSACVVDALGSAKSLAAPGDGVDSYLIVQNTSRERSRDFVRSSRNYLMGLVPGWDEAELAVKEKLLRDIFGNPFQPMGIDPRWRTSAVVDLARGMYQSRDFSAMPILADALEDAGCSDVAILEHCREPNAIHVRGCWVVDGVLGKR